ncbi:tape measure protein [Rhodococcus phage Mbo4]|uniref:Tape measure protein n=2 Tax=root TaxID=1 RepID=A0A9E7IH22_9CAUD|nr:phage tail tape measure protein [Rhodococcus opacus]YP_010755920.1 tape measure protein [Rhodococcus phage Mbo4]EKT83038.1 Gp22 [Rhodococcus opacus M213]URG17505.1 tape measure protein [Rhodococcus phage Mbo4]
MATRVAELYAELTLRDDSLNEGLEGARDNLNQLGQASDQAATQAQRGAARQAQAYREIQKETEKAYNAARTQASRAVTATERVEVVERRLADAVREHGRESEQAQRVERQLTQARGDAERIARNAERANDNYRISLQRTEQAQRDASRAAEQAGTSLRDLMQTSERAGRSMREAIPEEGQVNRFSAALSRAASSTTQFSASGTQMGGNFLSGFADSVGDLAGKTGPIAGSLLGVAALGLTAGALLMGAIKDGMAQEKNLDLFQAQTGITEAQARKFGLAAGEAYADVFGSSVEENLSTLKLALQSNIIDPAASQRDAEAVVANLDTITAALDGEVSMSVAAVSALMSNGLAASAQEASDMIANAVGGSANKEGDLLEVVKEYSSGWKNAGLSAEYALALIEQSTDNGADNADRAGDSLREFGRRVTEEGDTIVAALNDIGLNGTDMYAAFKRGGSDAEDAFDQAFDKIRSIEDPVKRNQAAMALLGDTAGDFIGSLAQWDPSKALADFGEFEGAAGRLASTIGGNAATSVEGASRAIGLAADGLKGALASAAGPYIQDFADTISNNRAGVIQFFIDAGNAGFEAAKAVLSFVEGGLRGLADFSGSAAEAGASFLEMGANIIAVGDAIPGFGTLMGLATGDAAGKLRDLADATRAGGEGVHDVLIGAAEGINGTLLPALDQMQTKFNDVAGGMKDSAAFNDATAKMSKSIGEVGVQADGSKMKLEGFTGAAGQMVPPGLAESITKVKDGLQEQIRTGIEAGNTIEQLTAQYGGNRVALIEQLMATGMSNDAALNYINTLGLTPELINTVINQPGMPEAQYALDQLKIKIIDTPDSKTIVTEALTEEAIYKLREVGYTVETMKDGTVRITADTKQGEADVQAFIERDRWATVKLKAEFYANQYFNADGSPKNVAGPTNYGAANNGPQYGPVVQRADGAVMAGKFAAGGFNAAPGFDKLPDWATIMSPRNNLIQWAEPETQGEAFIPLAFNKRARSMNILAEVARRFGVRLINDEYNKVFNGDPSSLTADTDPTGWRALLGGQYSERSRRLGVEESNPLVAAVLGMRQMIVNGNYDGNLRALGIEEDNPLVDGMLSGRKLSFADGGIVDSLTGIQQSKFPALQVTDTYRPGAADYHGAGQAVDFSNGSGNTDDQLAFANYMADNYKDQLAELIYIDPRFGRCIKDGKFVPDSFYAGAGDHTNHVHVAAKEALSESPTQSSQGPDNRSEREKIVDTIVAEGRRRGISEKGIKAAIAAGLAETDLQNLDYGMDGDNAGILQQRDNGAWGTLEDRKDPARAAGMFYDKLDDFDYESMDPADAAQMVQQSGTADGSNYRAELAEADQLYADSVARGTSTSPTAGASPSSSSGSSMSGGLQDVRVTNFSDLVDALKQGSDASKPQDPQPWLTGNLKMYANGGIEDHSPQIARPGDYRVFGEPETEGEAYIPFAMAKRARALAIWRETGRRLGVAAYAGGGFGGYSGPDTEDVMKPRNLYDAAALATGIGFTAVSGGASLLEMAQSGKWDLSKLVPSFDTSNNDIPGLGKAFDQMTQQLQEITDTLQKGGMIQVDIDVDSNGVPSVSFTKAGLA